MAADWVNSSRPLSRTNERVCCTPAEFGRHSGPSPSRQALIAGPKSPSRLLLGIRLLGWPGPFPTGVQPREYMVQRCRGTVDLRFGAGRVGGTRSPLAPGTPNPIPGTKHPCKRKMETVLDLNHNKFSKPRSSPFDRVYNHAITLPSGIATAGQMLSKDCGEKGPSLLGSGSARPWFQRLCRDESLLGPRRLCQRFASCRYG